MRTRILTVTIPLGLALCLAVALAQRATPSAPEEQGIRETLERYAGAYNRADLATLMSFWAPGAEYVDEAGKATRGKQALATLFRTSLERRKGKTLSIKITSLRLLRPDLAMLDGTTTVRSTDGSIETDTFASVWTKGEDGWRVLSVRDLPDTDEADSNPSAGQLHSLDWLIGDWVYRDRETTITISCRPTERRSFLIIDQVVRVKGEEILGLKEVIGWDPLQQQFRSWVFDSAGGFGEGRWTRRGNEWVVAAEGVRSDARTASATNVWRFVDDNTFEWASTDRQIDGQPEPDTRVRYTRKASGK